MISREERRLQLAYPVPALRQRVYRVACQMTLELPLIEALIAELAESCRQPAKSADETELRGDAVDDETEPDVRREPVAGLGFELHLGQGFSGREQIRDQGVAAVPGKGD